MHLANRNFFLIFFFRLYTLTFPKKWRLRLKKEVFQSHNRILPLHQKI